MTASQLQLLGILLTAGGTLLLVLSQIALSKWHQKMLHEY